MQHHKAVRALLATNASGVGNGAGQTENSMPEREQANPMSISRGGSPSNVSRAATPTFAAEVSTATAATEPVNPFADEPYFVSGPSDVAAVIRSG